MKRVIKSLSQKKQVLLLMERSEKSLIMPIIGVKACSLKRKNSCKSINHSLFLTFYRLGETLLQKETMALPDIVEVLG
jgi:hypothetical protein